jgi:hypothetical protein
MSSGVERPIQMDDLIESVHNTTPSTLEWLSTVKNYIKYSNQSKLYSDVSKYMMKNRIMD